MRVCVFFPCVLCLAHVVASLILVFPLLLKCGPEAAAGGDTSVLKKIAKKKKKKKKLKALTEEDMLVEIVDDPLKV